VEKTPNHMLMTRFLQQLFTPARTKFVVTIRHPMGCSHFKWKLVKQLDNFRNDCGAGCGPLVFRHDCVPHDWCAT
jgi:hypothetical protein